MIRCFIPKSLVTSFKQEVLSSQKKKKKLRGRLATNMDGVLDNVSWSTFSRRPIKMINHGENRTSIRSRNRTKINFKGALSCRFPFQNTLLCCDVKKPCHNITSADAAGCASHGGLLLTWSSTSLCDVVSDMCQQNSTIIAYFKYLKLIVWK